MHHMFSVPNLQFAYKYFSTILNADFYFHSTTAASKSSEIHRMDALCVCYVTCFPADVTPWPLRGVVTAVRQLRSGAGALALYPVWASWAHGRKAALQCDGRRKAGPKGTAARKRLQLHSGCLEGGMTPTGVKEEGSVCGDVRRRKKS